MTGDDILSQRARLRLWRTLHREGSLGDAAWAQANRLLRSATVWREWVRRVLLLIGAPLVLAGIICFFAYNWSDIPRGLKLGLCQAAVLGAVIGHVWNGRQRLSGRVWLLAATVLIGVWLTVYGQAYQTGADAFELFVAWAALVTGWVVISDLAAAWLIWMVLWNTAVILYWQQVVSLGSDELGSEFLCVALAALNGVGLALAECSARRRVARLEQRWFQNVLLAAVLVSLTIPAFRVVVSTWDPPSALFVGYWCVGVMAGYYVYRCRIRDLTALTQVSTSATVILVATVSRLLLHDDPLSMLLLGLVIVGASAVLVWWVRSIGAAMQREQKQGPGGVGPRPVSGRSASIGDREAKEPSHPPVDPCGEGLTPRDPELCQRQEPAGAAAGRDGPRSEQALAITGVAGERTYSDLLHRLASQGTLGPDERARVVTRLAELAARRRDPLFSTVIIGIGAWCAACALAAASAFGGLLHNRATAVAGGLGGMIAGIVLLRLSQPSLFTRQLGLALAVAGNLLLLYAGGDLFWGDDWTAIPLAQVVITLVAYLPLRSAGYRLAAPLSVLTLLVWWFYAQQHLFGLYGVVAAELLGTGVLFLRKRLASALEPLAYATVIALPATILTMQLVNIAGPAAPFHFSGWDLSEYRTALWPLGVLLGFSLVALYDHLAGGGEGGAMGQRWFWLAAGGTLFLAAFTTPGVLVAVGLLVLGFGTDDRAITVLGWVFLGVFLVLYYYALDVTLAYKSAVLIGSGALALAARWALGRWAFDEPKEVP